jgi:hypothetical protein
MDNLDKRLIYLINIQKCYKLKYNKDFDFKKCVKLVNDKYNSK